MIHAVKSGFRIVGAAACALLLAGPAAAQREAVLKQIGVPHPYYFREMYLPQVTSGPAAAAWSPDGRNLVVAMQGSLWRLDPASGVARQLTDGPGYDHQPDWSPDGRFIAFASYAEDAVELRALEVATGRTWSLTANRAVNVEPRWSPDSRRIAFVSTAYERRFHVFVLDVTDGKPGTALRVTEDRDSGLPRYYYSRYDHYLSPTWSPDGAELLLVCNRGRIWGTGGLWRMRAEPGAPLREVRDEETSWQARPDWARDGRRVAYASYLGRNWHQLWLMTSEGGVPVPLTYGDFDVTGPRFSPDGTRIAYISNQGGNTSLGLMTLPGGARTRVEIKERRPLRPGGRLHVAVFDEKGEVVPARVSVTGPDGRGFAPDDAWRHADDSFDRKQRAFEVSYFHTAGDSTLSVPAGRFTVEVSHGLEYRVDRQMVEVAQGATREVRVALTRLDDLPARGWWSGDVHVHMNYGGRYRNDPAHLAFQAAAEDLHLVENLIVNKEQRIPDLASFDRGRVEPGSRPRVLVVHSQEFHTSFWGHLGLLGLTDHLLIPDYAAYTNTPAASLFPHNAAVADLAHAQGALVGYVHPYDADPDPANRERDLTHELPVDVALGKVDYYEALGFVDDPWATQKVWYRLLDCGFRLPAAGGTDAMANYASLRGPVGLNRVYVKSGKLDHAGWLAGLRAGRSFATNGPLLSFTLDGHGPGETVELPAGAHPMEARIHLRSIVPVDHVQVVANGVVVAEVPLSGDHTSVDATLALPVARSGWYLLRAFADHAQEPILDLFPLATTSPVYVTVAGRPTRSPADAQYFMAWIDRMTETASSHPAYNTEAERTAVLTTLAQARAVFAERSRR